MTGEVGRILCSQQLTTTPRFHGEDKSDGPRHAFSMASKSPKPWQHPAKKKSKHTHLSGAQKQAAKQSANRAGRPYPNLVDNMRQAKKSKS